MSGSVHILEERWPQPHRGRSLKWLTNAFLLSFRCLVARRKVSEQRWADAADSTVALSRKGIISDTSVQCIQHFQQKVRFNTNHTLLFCLWINMFVFLCNPQISPAFSWQPVHLTITPFSSTNTNAFLTNKRGLMLIHAASGQWQALPAGVRIRNYQITC